MNILQTFINYFGAPAGSSMWKIRCPIEVLTKHRNTKRCPQECVCGLIFCNAVVRSSCSSEVEQDCKLGAAIMYVADLAVLIESYSREEIKTKTYYLITTLNDWCIENNVRIISKIYCKMSTGSLGRDPDHL